MRKSVKILLIISLIILAIVLISTTYYLIITWKVNLDENKLVNLNNTVTYVDVNGNVLGEESSKLTVTNINEIPKHVKNAFISIEDKRFYNHKGIDYKGLTRAVLNNVKTFSLKEGASTISQQLIKNTHLSSEKTLNRKLKEYKLVKQLERKYSKDEILEKYLNSIYFGNNCYGITEASKNFFNKKPSELTINEGAILAAIIKAPTTYSPINHKDKCFSRKQVVLKEMYSQKYITKEEYNKAINEDVCVSCNSDSRYLPLYLAKKEFGKILENRLNFNKKYKVYTTIDNNIQNIIENNSSEVASDKSTVVMRNDFSIAGYLSTCGDIKRPMGSVIKPVLVYAPAIERDVITPYTLINDEKTNFNGYSPSNYGNRYLGNISVKKSIAVSSNVCAVKILNSTGIENSLNYLRKTDIEVTKNDNSLCIALGATEKGATLVEIVASYNTFSNEGYYNSPYIIYKIEDEFGRTIYRKNMKKNKIFSEDTTYLINDMLAETVKSGTAKKLSFANGELCGKTGTVGNEKGNTDAYSISYNTDYAVGIWYGNANNSLMDNSITGGSRPSADSLQVWNEIYREKDFPIAYKSSNKIKKIKLDRLSYENGKIEIADYLSPERYTIEVPTKLSTRLPTSTRFSSPNIEKPILSVNNNTISIQLCQTELYNYLIIKSVNGKERLKIDTSSLITKDKFIDYNNNVGDEVSYTLIPYYKSDDVIYYGNKIYLDKIKISPKNSSEKWWKDDFNN